ncbi:MAG: vWA domain-containing protein [Desulfobulbaceae bacterium]
MIELPAQFHFLRPEWFWMLVPAALLLAVLCWRRLRTAGLERICDPALLPHLLLDKEQGSPKFPLALLALAWLLAVTALAGPAWQKQPQPVYRLQKGRVLVLDLSPSMAATDITPSRLERARYKIEDILKKSREGRTALVVFSAEPHVVVPLTDDVATIASMLPALSVDIMPEIGNSAGKALETAATLLQQDGLKGGDLILITDGIDDLASSLLKAETLRKKGVRLFVLGIGSENGAPVPDPTGSGFVTDSAGTPRLSHLDASSLQELATSGGGRYSALTSDDQDITTLFADVERHSLQESEAANKSIDLWQEKGIWLVLPVLLLALAGFRRGWLVGLLLLLALRPEVAAAMNWQDLWLRPDQQAAQQLAKGNAAKAAELFTDPAWRAVAQHEAGNYRDAIETGKTLRDGAGQYNLGNSLARAGRLAEALAAYDEALQLNPADQDAKYNRELIRKLQEEKNKEQQKDQTGNANDQQQQNGEKKQGQQGGGKQQERQDQQPGNSSDQQQQNGEQGQQGDRTQQNKQTDDAARQQKNQQKQEGPRQKSEKEENGQGSQEKNSIPAQGKQEQEKKNKGEKQDQQEGQAPQTGPQQPLAPQPQMGTVNGENDRPAEKHDPAVLSPDNQEYNVPDKKDLVLEQWLRQVPDDPSGLLRRKFMLEHQRRQQEGNQP